MIHSGSPTPRRAAFQPRELPREPRHVDRNLGLVLACWDWLFGTLYLPRWRETFALGLADGEHEQYDSVLGIYALPFRKAAGRLLSRARS